jgi:hypothetical protein
VQHSLKVYYCDYTSLHVFTQPDKGKAVGKPLKNSRCSFIKEGIERKKNQCHWNCTDKGICTLKHSQYLKAT